MKSSAIKILLAYINKRSVNNLKKKINIRNVAIVLIAIIITLILSYLLKPFFFDYSTNNQILKEKINNYLNVESNINGKVNFNLFPTPRLVVEGLEISLNKKKEDLILIKKSNFLISFSKLQSIESLKFKKFYIKKQQIKLDPDKFITYLEYFQKYNANLIALDDCKLFFEDKQKNLISLNNFDLSNKFKKDQVSISIKGLFSKNKFKIKFTNNKEDRKILNFSMPALKTKLKIDFDKNSNLKKTAGKLNLKILNNILLINFDGGEFYKISDSFFRSKFLNSKINGNINFKNNFYFNLNFGINQVNFKKLFSYYNSFFSVSPSSQFNISKKINGKINISMKKTESYLGKIKDTDLTLLFENGDIKIKSGSANLGENSLFKFNISFLGTGKDRRINFFLNFVSNDANKILKKFNLSSDDNNMSFNAVGKIDVTKKEIRFEKLIYNNQLVGPTNTKIVKDLIDNHVIDKNVFGFLDFFKIKKFANESFKRLE